MTKRKKRGIIVALLILLGLAVMVLAALDTRLTVRAYALESEKVTAPVPRALLAFSLPLVKFTPPIQNQKAHLKIIFGARHTFRGGAPLSFVQTHKIRHLTEKMRKRS